MKVLVVGSGGREHAICTSVAKSPRVDKIYCAPGNAGIAALAECVPIGAMEFDKLVAFANSKDYQAYLVKHMEEIGKLYPMSDSTLELREADMKYKDELIKAYGTALEVEVSDKITIGGFIVKNKATNVVVDESLDFALENQKDWFYKTSGLMIK